MTYLKAFSHVCGFSRRISQPVVFSLRRSELRVPAVTRSARTEPSLRTGRRLQVRRLPLRAYRGAAHGDWHIDT